VTTVKSSYWTRNRQVNFLIVCDVGNRRLQIFGLDGKFVLNIDKHFPKDDSVLGSVAMSNN